MKRLACIYLLESGASAKVTAHDLALTAGHKKMASLLRVKEECLPGIGRGRLIQ